MTREELKTTAFYNVLRDTIKSMLIDNVDVLTDKLMPILEPFVEDKLEKFKQYEDVLKQIKNPIIIMQPQWTEEDEKCIDNCCLLIGAADDCYEKTFKDDCIHYLQSLKERMEGL